MSVFHKQELKINVHKQKNFISRDIFNDPPY